MAGSSETPILLRNCAHCDAIFRPGNRSITCSSDCRVAYRKSERQRKERERLESRRLTCAECGITFTPQVKHGPAPLTCSDVCATARQQANRARWEDRNPTYKADYNRAYYQANGDRLRAASQQYYAANREDRRQYRRDYYLANRELIIAAQQIHTRRRLALKKSAPGEGLTLEHWEIILELSDGKCSYCRKILTKETRIEIEHVIPLSRGGWDDPSNIVPACRTCNSSKHDKTAAEWMPEWVAPSWIILREVTN